MIASLEKVVPQRIAIVNTTCSLGDRGCLYRWGVDVVAVDPFVLVDMVAVVPFDPSHVPDPPGDKKKERGSANGP